ncbi:MAG: putative toxin-antitoxin system antitoxin component [Planctomycetota bacterium]|nr:MAG: putative toxin-antitoxin system antitoxin component [Planctomycetota bacterium]
MSATVAVSDMLGITMPRAATAVDYHDRISRGLPRTSLRRVERIAGVLPGQLAGILGVHLRTLTRAERRKSAPLEPVLSDRLYRFAQVVGRAAEVMESPAGGRQWLAAPQYGLGGRTPLSLLRTEAGTSEVLHLLGRIEHGDLA